MFPLQVKWEVPEAKQTECIKKGKDAEVSGVNPLLVWDTHVRLQDMDDLDTGWQQEGLSCDSSALNHVT